MIKKIFIALVLIASLNNIYSQNNFYTLYENAIENEDLVQAKLLAAKLTTNFETEDQAKAWFYKAKVYHQISDTLLFNPNNKKFITENASDTASYSYIKALALNSKKYCKSANKIVNNEKLQRDIIKTSIEKKETVIDEQINSEIINNYLYSLINTNIGYGIYYFKKYSNYTESLKYFGNALFLSEAYNKIDTLVLYYAAISSEKSNDYAKAVELYGKLAKLNYGDDEDKKAAIYIYMARAYKSLNNEKKYLKVLSSAEGKFPNTNSVIVEKANYYIDKKQPDKAMEMLEKALKMNQNNAMLNFSLAYLYDEQRNFDNAINYYKKAILVDSNYFDANYNLAVIYYNRAVSYEAKAKEFQGKDENLYNKNAYESKTNLNNAIPYFEKAHELLRNEKSVIEILERSYSIVGNWEKAQEMKNKLKVINGN